MKDKSKPKKEILTIKGLMNDDDIRWKKIPCMCSQNPALVQEIYPIKNCLHCKFQECENDLAREPFDIIETKEGKNITHHITEIQIVRGKKYDDIQGYKAEW